MPLGKSLDNILGDYFGQTEVSLENQALARVQSGSLKVEEIKISQVELSPYQTRTRFEQAKILTLSKNIESQGLIQPIIVLKRKVTDSLEPKYVLLAGERRLRAVKLLGWEVVPAVVKTEDELSEKQQAMISAMENLQREDLSPIELSQTYKMLILTQGLTEESLARLLGFSVQYIKNYLRLLTLTQEVKDALAENKIKEGQARHLVGLSPKKQLEVLKVILEKDLTVKEIVKLLKKNKDKSSSISQDTRGKFHQLPPEIITKADKLASNFPNAKLQCKGSLEKGKIVISWGNGKKPAN